MITVGETLKKMLQLQAESGPCACGKREVAKPQTMIDESLITTKADEQSLVFAGQTRVCADFVCGSCKQCHACMILVPTELAQQVTRESNATTADDR